MSEKEYQQAMNAQAEADYLLQQEEEEYRAKLHDNLTKILNDHPSIAELEKMDEVYAKQLKQQSGCIGCAG